MSKESLKRWHGAHHYSDKIHLFLIVFLFFGVFTLTWSYFTLSDLRFRTSNMQSKQIKTRIVPSPMLTPAPTQTQTATPTPTCRPRPACLDSVPKCLIAETEDMCQPTITPTRNGNVVCTMEAKLCPDGKTYVGRSGPNCEFSKCP